MPGPLKNARHERFAQEYLIDRDAFRAAADCGIALKSGGDRFYIYLLIDGRDGSILYIGKGTRERLRSHRRQAANPNSTNQVKARRIAECGEHLAERILVDGLDEAAAYRIEKHLILALRHTGLTNISSGSVHPLESLLERIDANMRDIRPYDDWIAKAGPDQLAAARKLKGSTETFYAAFLDEIRENRRYVERQLAEIRNA